MILRFSNLIELIFKEIFFLINSFKLIVKYYIEIEEVIVVFKEFYLTFIFIIKILYIKLKLLNSILLLCL